MTAFPPPDPSSAEAIDTTASGADAVRIEQIVGMSFDKVTRADEVLLGLAHLQQEGEITLTDAVVVSKDANGHIHIRQTVDPTPGRAAITGSFWGLLAGSFFGGPVFIAGAAVGAGGAALMAKLIDLGLDDHWVKQVAKWLDPGTSALLLLVADDVRPTVVRELSRFEGTVIYCTFPEAVRRELEQALADGSSTGSAGSSSSTGGSPFARYPAPPSGADGEPVAEPEA